jgi:hypothetical protein
MWQIDPMTVGLLQRPFVNARQYLTAVFQTDDKVQARAPDGASFKITLLAASYTFYLAASRERPPAPT